MATDAVHALRAAGIDARTVSEQGPRGRGDAEQLMAAREMGRILVTSNIRDFASLHARLMRAGERHDGILPVRQGQFGLAETTKRVARVATELAPADMENRLEYLGSWEPLE